MQQALGLIETRGTVAAIEAADAMVKAAKVKFLGRQKVKAGLMAVMVAGDVGADPDTQTSISSLSFSASVVPAVNANAASAMQRNPKR